MYTYINFRKVSVQEMHREAVELLHNRRRIPAPDSKELLVPSSKKAWGPDEHQVNNSTIAINMTDKGDNYVGQHKDQHLMADFVNNLESGKVIIPFDMPIKKVIPGGVPLMDILGAHRTKTDTWKYPSEPTFEKWSRNRCVTHNSVQFLETKEIVVGISSESEIAEVHEWLYDRHSKNQHEFPSAVIPVSVNCVQMTTYDTIRMTKEEKFGKQMLLETKPGKPREGEEKWFLNPDGSLIKNGWVNFPTKIIIGDGVEWILAISFDMTAEGEFKFCTPAPIPQNLVDLLEGLPPSIGFYIAADIKILERTFQRFGFEEFTMHLHIDVSSLAVLAGWKLNDISMAALSLISLGVPVNELSANGDGLWGLRFEYLPTSLQLFLISQVKSAFLTYNVILSMLREEVIADPDIWCYLTEEDQYNFLRWWAAWIAQTLRGIAVDWTDLFEAKNREQVMRVLRVPGPNGELLNDPPYRIELMIKIREGCFTLSCGGNRFLHIERERALKQYSMFSSELITGFKYMFSEKLTNDKLLYARFDQSLISDLDETRHVPFNSQTSYLTFHPKLPLKQLEINIKELDIPNLLRLARAAKRSPQEGTLEWLRLHVSQCDDLFRVFIRNTSFSKKYKSIYEPLRMIAKRVTNVSPIEVPACEKNIKLRQEKVLRDEIFHNNELQQAVKDAISRKEESDRIIKCIKRDIELGKEIDRSRFRPVHQKSTAQNDEGDRRTLGVSPEERQQRQAEAPVPTFPVRRSSHSATGDGWIDENEVDLYGRASPVSNSDSSSDSESTTSSSDTSSVRSERQVRARSSSDQSMKDVEEEIVLIEVDE